ncbi:MAG: MATE family efflux transporter [Oscillospiraceae bacterium]|nr:MATE family efflux transporter [Oscillospiraceae bacterium]
MAVIKQGKQDLTQGPLAKQIILFSIPLILSNLLQVLFNMADVAVVGRFGGPGALGAVGSTTILVSLFTGLLIGLSSGVNVLTALHFGAKARRELAETVHASALICALAGLMLLAVGVIFARPILELLRTKDELIGGAVLYLRIYMLGMPALGIYNFGNAVFSAVGDTRRPLRYLSAAGVLNVVLNLFFVIVCGLDVAGVALASVLSQYLSAILILAALFRRGGEIYGLRRRELRLYRYRSRVILSIGVPSALQHGIFALANLFIQTGVNSFSAVMVEGNAAAANADNLVYDVMAAFYTACSSFIGQNYGAGKWDRIRKSYLISMGYAFGIALAMGLGLFACGPLFLSLFTTEAAVVEAGMKRLAIMSISYCVSAFMDGTIAASRGLGRSLGPMVIVVLGSCVFRILWVYTVFAHFRTIESLYLLYIFSWGITAAAEVAYFRRAYGRLKREHLGA